MLAEQLDVTEAPATKRFWVFTLNIIAVKKIGNVRELGIKYEGQQKRRNCEQWPTYHHLSSSVQLVAPS